MLDISKRLFGKRENAELLGFRTHAKPYTIHKKTFTTVGINSAK